ncbi:MAG: hypothetical protein Q3971_02940 [Moraxella sp.]|nr:hypothetical protein [Moraxella sp.]
MLNTQIPTNGNNIKNTSSYPNVILDNGTAQNHGKITASQTTLPTDELINLKDTLDNPTTAFDDVATVATMLLNDELSSHKQHALLRLLQSHAYEHMGLCDSETYELKERLGGAR